MSRILTIAVLALLVLAGLAIVAAAVSHAVRAPLETRIVVPDQSTNEAQLRARVEGLSSLVGAYADRVDGLDNLVTLLVGLSSLYAVALGVTSYVNMTQVMEQSKKSVEQLDSMREDSREDAEAVRELRERLDKESPELARLAIALKEIVETLNRLLPQSMERSKVIFKRVNVMEILEAERLSGILQHLGTPAQASQLLRGLGLFYSIQYTQQEKKEEDLHRSHYYLQRALLRDRNNFIAHNDLAFVLEDSGDVEAAQLHFNESLRIEPHQQRALYNLARYTAKGDLNGAEALLTEALGYSNWQTASDDDRRRDILYNRACYRSRLGKRSEDTTFADSALQDLQNACNPKTKEVAETLQKDIHDDEELGWLYSQREDEVDRLLTQS